MSLALNFWEDLCHRKVLKFLKLKFLRKMLDQILLKIKKLLNSLKKCLVGLKLQKERLAQGLKVASKVQLRQPSAATKPALRPKSRSSILLARMHLLWVADSLRRLEVNSSSSFLILCSWVALETKDISMTWTSTLMRLKEKAKRKQLLEALMTLIPSL